MDFLPELDIQQDLELLAEEDNKDVSIAVEDLSKSVGPTLPKDIFVGKPTNGSKPKPQVNKRVVKKGTVTPVNDDVIMDNDNRRLIDVNDEPDKVDEVLDNKKVKKPLSEKQKAHLEKIRIKALAAKKEKARLKKEVKERVEMEVRQKRKGKTKSQGVVQEPEPEPEFIEKTQLPKAPQVTFDPNQSFNNFMANMDKYKRMKYDYQNKQRAAQEKQLQYQQPKPKPQPKPAPQHIVRPQKPSNPYDGIFNW